MLEGQRTRSTLRHTILGLLALRPRTGYAITKALTGGMANVWTVNHSQVYGDLRSLLADGLIREAGVGGRRSRLYATTPAGDDAFRTWMLQTVPSRDSRNESVLRIFFLGLLDSDEATSYLRTEAEWHRRQLKEYEEIAATPVGDDPEWQWSRIALDWGLRYEAAIADWLDWAVTQVKRTTRPRRVSARGGSATRRGQPRAG